MPLLSIARDFSAIAVSFLLTVICAVKVMATVNTVRWTYRYGAAFLKAMNDAHGDMLPGRAEIYRLYEENRGGFFPFGVKDFRLKRKYGGSIVEAIHGITFKYRSLVLILPPIVLLNVIPLNQTRLLPETLHALSEAICFLFFLMNSTVIIEMIFENVFLSDYMKFFHMLDGKSTFERPMNFISDRNYYIWLGMKGIFRLTANIFLFGISASALGFTTHGAFHFPDDAFGGNPFVPVDGHVDFSILTRFAMLVFYWVATTITTTGYGDIYPAGFWGYFVAVALHLDSYLLITFGATLFWATRPQ